MALLARYSLVLSKAWFSNDFMDIVTRICSEYSKHQDPTGVISALVIGSQWFQLYGELNARIVPISFLVIKSSKCKN